MFKRLFSYLSMQAFHVSSKRKYTFLISFALLVAVLLIRIYWQPSFEFEFFSQLLSLLTIFLLAYFFANFIRIPIISTYRIRNKISDEDRDNFILGINSVTTVLVALVTVFSIFPIFGFDFVRFLTIAGLFAAGLMWTFKEPINSFVDGFVMMFSNNFKIGDYIKLNDSSKGIIRDITFRSTRIRTDDGNMLYIPNNVIMNSEVVNFSKAQSKRISIPFTLPLASVMDTDHFEKTLIKQLVKEFPDVVEEDKVYLRILSIGEQNMQFSLGVRVSTYSFILEDRIKKFVYTQVVAYSNNKRT